MVEDVGEHSHVQHYAAHGVSDRVLACDDANGVERQPSEGHAVARGVVAPQRIALVTPAAPGS